MNPTWRGKGKGKIESEGDWRGTRKKDPGLVSGLRGEGRKMGLGEEMREGREDEEEEGKRYGSGGSVRQGSFLGGRRWMKEIARRHKLT